MSLNPAMEVPTIIEGYQTIIGDGPTLYKYLCKGKTLDEKFYPHKEMNMDRRQIIDKILEWS